MSEFRFEIFDGECEAVGAIYEKGYNLKISFTPKINGHLMIGEQAFKVENGICEADIRRLSDGLYIPCLYTEESMIRLPEINKNGRMARLTPPAEGSFYRLSAAWRAIAARIKTMEEKINFLEKQIEGASLTIGDNF